MAKIRFTTQQLEYEIPAGSELLEAYRKQPELPLKFGCKKGKCGVCSIEVGQGREHLTKRSGEELETLHKKGLSGEEYRLACQCALNGDIEICRLV